jgi:hypothetical protein
MVMTIDAPNPTTFPNATLYPNSKVWSLNINQFGTTLASFKYIQIVNGTGSILPAFNRFVTQQPGDVFFRGLRDNQPYVPCGGGLPSLH